MPRSTLHLIAKNIQRFDKLTRLPFPDYNTILKASDKVLKTAMAIGIFVPKTIL